MIFSPSRVYESWRSESEANEWLKLVKTSSSAFVSRFSPFFCSLLICGSAVENSEKNESGESLAVSVLLWLADNQPEVSGRVTLTFLYQLAQAKRPLQQLALLRAIAVMGKHEVLKLSFSLFISLYLNDLT